MCDEVVLVDVEVPTECDLAPERLLNQVRGDIVTNSDVMIDDQVFGLARLANSPSSSALVCPGAGPLGPSDPKRYQKLRGIGDRNRCKPRPLGLTAGCRQKSRSRDPRFARENRMRWAFCD